MLVWVLQLALAQGPGSTLQPSTGPSSLPPSTVPVSELQPRSLPGTSATTLELRGQDALIRKVGVVEGRTHPCEMLAVQARCDDPSVVSFELKNEPLTVSENTPPIVPHFVFVARKPGRTVCSCGVPRTLQLVYEFTVTSIEDAVRPVARKVVGAAFARLYRQNSSLVP